MAVSILNQFFDINMLAAIAAEPNGITITGHLFQMLSLATKDPEGCVRLVPNSYMDAVSFARIFNCTVALVLDSIRTLQKLGIVSMEDGMLFINQLRKAFQDKRAAKAEAEMKKAKAEETRRKTNARVKKCRAIKKTGLEANTTPESKAETEIFSETKVAVSEMEPGNGDCPAPTKTKYATNSAPENETETMNDAHRNTMENHADTIAEKRAASNTSENETEPCNVDCNALLPVPAKKRKKQRKEIIGASGSGKSYMAAEIVNALTDKGYRCKFITTLQLLFRYNNLAYENRNYFLEQFFEQDLIILDDFGMEANTAGNGQILLYIVSTCRLLRIPVIVTTPYHKEVLMKEVGKGPFHAVVKRLMEICVPFTVPMPPNRCQRNLQQKKETETMLDLNPAAEPGLFAEPAEACPETTVTACLPEAVQQTLPL